MEIQVKSNVIKKNWRGEWMAKARIDLTAPRQLQITTMKSASGKLRTYASVVEIEESTTTPGIFFEKFELFGDFNKTYLENKVRCTAKAIEKQQDEVLAIRAQVLVDAKVFYANKGIAL
jgi:hypothetical protein